MSLSYLAYALGSWKYKAALLVPILVFVALAGAAAQLGDHTHTSDNPNMDPDGNLVACPTTPNGWECRASGGTCGPAYAGWTIDWVNADKNGNPRCVPPTPAGSITGG
jgi:hypothetical protein